MLCFALRCLRGITEPSMAKSDLLGLMTISGALSVLHGYRVMNGVTLSQRTLKLFSALTLNAAPSDGLHYMTQPELQQYGLIAND